MQHPAQCESFHRPVGQRTAAQRDAVAIFFGVVPEDARDLRSILIVILAFTVSENYVSNLRVIEIEIEASVVEYQTGHCLFVLKKNICNRHFLFYTLRN